MTFVIYVLSQFEHSCLDNLTCAWWGSVGRVRASRGWRGSMGLSYGVLEKGQASLPRSPSDPHGKALD